MSTETFFVKVRSKRGDTFELEFQTATARGPLDCALTRSFIIQVLRSGMQERQRRSRSSAATPLLQAIDQIVKRENLQVHDEAF